MNNYFMADSDSSSESDISDKLNIIAHQIEDDLATHDFSKPHVSREAIQKMLGGIKVKNVGLYQQALVHKSIHKAVKRYTGNLQGYLTQHNERLEFLGDSVLGLVVANYLYHRFPDNDEGFLTRIKTKLVNGTQLAKIARSIGLGEHILMSNHVVSIKGRDSQKILEDAFEAFLAALYKDLGFDAVYSFIVGIIDSLDFDEILVQDNYKDMLIKYCQHSMKNIPLEYRLISTEGPPHNRLFTIAVVIGNVEYSQATAKSKKQAEQIASEKTINNLICSKK
jgi:ribonuclease-3